MSNTVPLITHLPMIDRSDIIWLGVAAGVIGSITGGLMLGIGMNMIVAGANFGWVLLLPAGPVAAIPGWLLARKLAARLR